MNPSYINGLAEALDQIINSKTNQLSLQELKTLDKVRKELLKSITNPTKESNPQDIANVLQMIVIIIELMKAGSS